MPPTTTRNECNVVWAKGAANVASEHWTAVVAATPTLELYAYAAVPRLLYLLLYSSKLNGYDATTESPSTCLRHQSSPN